MWPIKKSLWDTLRGEKAKEQPSPLRLHELYYGNICVVSSQLPGTYFLLSSSPILALSVLMVCAVWLQLVLTYKSCSVWSLYCFIWHTLFIVHPLKKSLRCSKYHHFIISPDFHYYFCQHFYRCLLFLMFSNLYRTFVLFLNPTVIMFLT